MDDTAATADADDTAAAAAGAATAYADDMTAAAATAGTDDTAVKADTANIVLALGGDIDVPRPP